MEEEFKKREEEHGGDDGVAMKGEEQGMEGVGDILDVLDVLLEDEVGVFKKGNADSVVLDVSCEDLPLVSNPSWVAVNGERAEKLDVCMVEEGLKGGVCNEEAIVNVVNGEGEEVCVRGGILAGEMEGGVVKSGGAGKAKGVLNWKEAVVGGGGSCKQGFSGGVSGGKMGEEDGAARGDVSGRNGVDGGGKGQVKGYGGGPMKVCREINFDEKGGGFLADDGETMHMDRSEVLECEKSLERALVGRILGRPVPFGFLHRELRKKWGKFGRAHLSLVGGNSFVCFFSSKEIRDAVLRGGPWFVGNQLVGVARWSSDFEPSSLKGFSTPIWVRFPQLPLNLWSDQNLGRIASFIGKPLWVDGVTSSWERTEFARVCVRIDFDKKLPKGVWVHDGEKRFLQSVVYEGIDQLCFQCGVVGYLNGDCLKNGRGVEVNGGEADMVEGQRRVAGDGLEKGAGGHQDSMRFGKEMGSSSKVVAADVVQEFRGKVKGKEVGDVGVFGFKAMGSAKEVVGHTKEGCSVVEEGGGDWTLVMKKKSKSSKPKNFGKQRGLSGQERSHGGGGVGRKEGIGLAGDPPLVKQMLVYKRVGVSATGSGVFSASKCLRPMVAGVGTSGLNSTSLKRPKGKEVVGMRSCGGEKNILKGGEVCWVGILLLLLVHRLRRV